MGRGLRGEANQRLRVAWLSLDEGDTDLTRFLTYLVAALQTLASRKSSGHVRQSKGLRRLARVCWLRSKPLSRRQPKRC